MTCGQRLGVNSNRVCLYIWYGYYVDSVIHVIGLSREVRSGLGWVYNIGGPISKVC